MSSALTQALKFFQLDANDASGAEIDAERVRSNVSFTSRRVSTNTNDTEGVADYEMSKLGSGTERLPMVPLSAADRDRWERLGSADLNRNLMTEAVVGSLPKPMSFEDKSTIRNSVPMSPTLDVISAMRGDFLSAATDEAQKRRLRLLSGAVVIVICAGYSGKRFIYEKAKQLGVRMIMIDGPECWARSLEAEGILERYIGLDFSEPDTVFDRCIEVIKGIRKELGNIDGIVTFLDMATPLTSRLCDALGYPGNAAAAVEVARAKHKTRAALIDAEVPTPGFAVIEGPDDLDAAAAKVGFPAVGGSTCTLAVLKPISGAASLGVVRVDDLDGMRTCYHRIQDELARTVYKDGAIYTSESYDVDTSQSKALGFTFQIMVEEYLDGPEVDVDCVLSNGTLVYSHVVDNWPTEEPWFLETGSNTPSVLSASQQDELKTMAAQCLRAMGLTHGVHHVELKYTSRGPRLIEVNPRMGGGCVRDQNLLTTGVDLVEEQLIACIGLPNNPPVPAAPLHHVAEYSVNAPQTGVIHDLSFLDKWVAHPDVVYARPLIEPGAKVVSSKDGLPTWIAEVMVTKATVQEAIQFVNEVHRDIVANVVTEAPAA